jgi:hypothetical protein
VISAPRNLALLKATAAMIESLLASLLLVVIAIVIAVLPSLGVVLLLRRIVGRRNRPLVWLLFLLATAAWCAAAVWSAKIFLTMDVASSPPGGGGITDPISVVVILGAMTLAVVAWLVVLAPSLPALVTLLVFYPDTPQTRATIRAGFQRFWGHPWRNAMLAVGGIALAGLLRAALWAFTGF